MTNWYQRHSELDSAIPNQPRPSMDSTTIQFDEGLKKIDALLNGLARSMSEIQQQTRSNVEDMQKILDRQTERFSEAIEAISKVSTSYEISDGYSDSEKFPIEGDHIQIAQDSPRKFDQQFEMLSNCVRANQEVELVDDGQGTKAPSPGIDRHLSDDDEFNKLEQMGEFEDYNQKFEDPEDYFVSSYIDGLKPEIKPLVKIGRPINLADSMDLSRLHYEAVREWNPEVELVDDGLIGEYGEKLAHTEESAEPFEGLNQEIKEILGDLLVQSKPTLEDELKEISKPLNDGDNEELQQVG